MTGERQPSLSIVVVALAGGDATRRLLDALVDLVIPAAGCCEILIAGEPEQALPGVTWLDASQAVSVPARRSLGAGRASGDVVAFLEDTVAPDPGWGEAVRTLHAAHPEAQAIGGTLRLDTARLSSRALALTLLDAGRFIRSNPTSEAVTALPGCNLSFKRAALERLGARSGAPLREADALPLLAKTAGALRLESGMAATCTATDERGLRASNRFQHGRLYAGHRGSSVAARTLRALSTPILPFVLVYRCWRVAQRTTLPSRAAILAHAFWMAGAWSLGEAAGYLFGPGDAERHWR